MKSAIKRTLREIVEYPWISKSNEIYNYDDLLNTLNYKITNNNYFEINYDFHSNDIVVETKIDVQYDHRRGAICQVLKFKNEPIVIFMGAGRELEDNTECYVLNLEACVEVLNMVERQEELHFKISNLDEEVDLLYWEGTPVDLGDKGNKG